MERRDWWILGCSFLFLAVGVLGGHLAIWYLTRPATPASLTGFSNMCQGFATKNGMVAHILETGDHLVCLAGDPRYEFKVKAVTRKEDLP